MARDEGVPLTVANVDAIARACFRSFAGLPNARVIEGEGLFGVMNDIPLNFFNGIAESRVERDDVPRVLASFEGRPFRWWISPSAQPPDLADVLQQHGMRHLFDSTGMVAALANLPEKPAAVEIERVDDLNVWIDVFLEGFHKPRQERDVWLRAYGHLDDWVHFLGSVDGVPVATTSLLKAGDLGGVYHVVTLPPFRGRGIGAAMTLAAMRAARDFGAKKAVLQSSEMGESVYRSAGFESICALRLFARL